MFDLVNKHKRLIQAVLAIIFLPFAFFGIDSYFRYGEGGQSVATISGHAISQQEFNKSLQERQRAIQRMMGGRVDPSILDNPELRQVTLEALIQRRLLLDRALRSGMTVSDPQLQSVVGDLELFRDESGKFALPRYRQFLKSEGETELTFETRLRHDLVLQQISSAYADTAFVPRSVAERLVRLAEQQREVSQFTLTPEQYAGQVKLEAGAAAKYYEANRSEFEVPEQVRVEYVTHSLEAQMAQVKVDPADVTRYYEANRVQFEQRESRARHILITADPAAGAEGKQKARARAEELYQRLKQKPDLFSEVAKQHSQDPGSAANGGDLGFLTRGAMKDVPEFEDALFRLKAGEISPPVETKLGFHVIQATEVRAARGKSLDETRGQIETDLKKQVAGRTFAELADKLNNTVYEQSESLKPAAELIKAAPRQSGWITRDRASDPLLNNPKLLQAVFSPDVLKNQRNTEAIEVAQNTLVAARVIEHKPAAVQAFGEVQSAIEKKLVQREASRLAAQEGKARLELLQQGKDAPATWSAPQVISRAEHKGWSEPVVRLAFRADPGKLPAYSGAESAQGGYTLIRVTRVVEAQNIAPEKHQEFAEGLRRLVGQEELTAYVASLKQKADVKIHRDLMEKKEEVSTVPSPTPSDRPAPRRRGL